MDVRAADRLAGEHVQAHQFGFDQRRKVEIRASEAGEFEEFGAEPISIVVLVEAQQASRGQAPATTHRVEITLGGKTTAVDTASPTAAKALLDTLTSLNRRTTAG